ncbi:unnamed protein product [Clonostachys rhizophaga]|uniref:NADH dehydrogenase [ubiquinone] 1 alpha subcomplex subunit n=1 Tax=Clonostachys rhizophaga TaxID=160324 RepID=A0A9N9VR34_9HYPO|nr:unnamed protein product [Clonostachys rhizophaga]
MAQARIGPLAQAWHKWKALRLPWRKRFLVGSDLNGNTYWEFRLTNGPEERWRRIVKYPRSTHFSEVKVSPLWHQWLRYTRDSPPSLEEQHGDVARQARMKKLAAEADARWEAKPRVMDAPGATSGQPVRALGSASADPESTPSQTTSTSEENTKEAKPDPWAKHKAQGPSENWQPEAWSPSARKK